MRRITLTVLLSLSMLLTTGNMPAVKATENTDLELVVFSKQDALEHYIQVSPHSVQVYFYTKKYCAEFKVPEEIAFSVARLETNYRGPDMFHYKPNQTSTADARGTYQVLVSTAKYVVEIYPEIFLEYTPDDINAEILLTNVHLNTKIGIKYLQHLNNIYKSWIIACGFYNTGYPRVNGYAKDAVKFYNPKVNV